MGPSTAEEFADALGLLDVTKQWEGDVWMEKRAATLLAGIHIKSKRDGEERMGGRRLWAPRATTNEIFMARRAGYESFEACEVFQAEATLLLNIEFNIRVRDMEKWVECVCDAPHQLGQEITRSRAYWNTRRQTWLAAMEYVL